MQTATKSLEQWLSECPDDYAFYCRFIDVKLDVESVAESEEVSLTDEQLDHVIDRFINLDWSVNNEIISCLLYTSPSPRDKRQSRMPSSA